MAACLAPQMPEGFHLSPQGFSPGQAREQVHGTDCPGSHEEGLCLASPAQASAHVLCGTFPAVYVLSVIEAFSPELCESRLWSIPHPS